jgi:hypothetical protein
MLDRNDLREERDRSALPGEDTATSNGFAREVQRMTLQARGTPQAGSIIGRRDAR